MDGMGYSYGVGMDGMVAGQPGGEGGTAATGTEAGEGEGGKAKGKDKEAGSNKFKRVAGGKSWQDETLADWPDSECPEEMYVIDLCHLALQFFSFFHDSPASSIGFAGGLQ